MVGICSLFFWNHWPDAVSYTHLDVYKRQQFTLYGFGADIGGGYTDDFYPLAQKDRLLTLLASVQENKGEMLSDPEIQAAYDKAMNVAKQLDADQDTVDQVYTDLQILLDVYKRQIQYIPQRLQAKVWR